MASSSEDLRFVSIMQTLLPASTMSLTSRYLGRLTVTKGSRHAGLTWTVKPTMSRVLPRKVEMLTRKNSFRPTYNPYKLLRRITWSWRITAHRKLEPAVLVQHLVALHVLVILNLPRLRHRRVINQGSPGPNLITMPPSFRKLQQRWTTCCRGWLSRVKIHVKSHVP